MKIVTVILLLAFILCSQEIANVEASGCVFWRCNSDCIRRRYRGGICQGILNNRYCYCLS
uniref:Potassium channel blocker pMeKTx21-1 n=1 Tax=Mesobuthus eupeus TaxID=34648 RepID=A0A088D9V0_MESEU|nr:potassium channel blocker pMeKTx21-1 [Mesobuthus eupeus]